MSNQQQIPTNVPNIVNILALDVGNKRIGLAIGNSLTRISRPLITIKYDASIWTALGKYIKTENISQLVVGLPRNLRGEDTLQTRKVRQFAKELQQHFNLPVELQDEALTSKQAEAELKVKGHPYQGSDIDSMAASLILFDYFNEAISYAKAE